MKTKLILLLIASLFLSQIIHAQAFYVDSSAGDNENKGSMEAPFKTLEKAVQTANELTGKGSINIKLFPGIYMLQDKLSVNPVRITDKSDRYTIEALIMPDDTSWVPEKMPVIISCSGNNSNTQFKHSTGFLVASDFVEFKGIKFLGNANPSVNYYYPITRENPNLKHLVVSQCIFIGDKNSGIIQGGIWAHGTDININHNVFYQCRNAILLFQNINNSVISNNIIYDAYESAFWMGDDANLKFENNIISHCDYFWIGNPDSKIEFQISNSIISENRHFRGNWGDNGITESKQKLTETNINKTDKIFLIERNSEKIPRAYLHITPESAGYDLNAGIFDNSKIQ